MTNRFIMERLLSNYKLQYIGFQKLLTELQTQTLNYISIMKGLTLVPKL